MLGVTLSYSFYIEAVRDIDRKIFISQQTCYLLSVKKLNFGTPKYLPTLNLADPETLDVFILIINLVLGGFKNYSYRFWAKIFSKGIRNLFSSDFILCS